MHVGLYVGMHVCELCIAHNIYAVMHAMYITYVKYAMPCHAMPYHAMLM